MHRTLVMNGAIAMKAASCVSLIAGVPCCVCVRLQELRSLLAAERNPPIAQVLNTPGLLARMVELVQKDEPNLQVTHTPQRHDRRLSRLAVLCFVALSFHVLCLFVVLVAAQFETCWALTNMVS